MGSTENTHTTERRFGTLAVHAGAPHDPVTGAVIAPVCYARSPLIRACIDIEPDLSLHYLCSDQRR